LLDLLNEEGLLVDLATGGGELRLELGDAGGEVVLLGLRVAFLVLSVAKLRKEKDEVSEGKKR
jgi:hypothetical protein